MKQFGFYFDSSRCSGCKTCQIACKDKKDLDIGPKFRRVYEYGGGSWIKTGNAWRNTTFGYYLSIACNHCDDPTCVTGCPSGAMQKRKEDGIVIVDPNLCVACHYCAMRCPYGAPQFNPEQNVMNKCDGCLDRLQQGLRPACIEACPQRAMDSGDIQELREKYGSFNEVAPLPDVMLTHPNLIIHPHASSRPIGDQDGAIQNRLEV